MTDRSEVNWPEVKAQLRILVRAKLEDRTVPLYEYIRYRTLVEGFIKQWEEVDDNRINTRATR